MKEQTNVEKNSMPQAKTDLHLNKTSNEPIREPGDDSVEEHDSIGDSRRAGDSNVEDLDNPRYPILIAESQGDLADRADIEIDQEIRQQIQESHHN